MFNQCLLRGSTRTHARGLWFFYSSSCSDLLSSEYLERHIEQGGKTVEVKVRISFLCFSFLICLVFDVNANSHIFVNGEITDFSSDLFYCSEGSMFRVF